jgi:hypothetical protein
VPDGPDGGLEPPHPNGAVTQNEARHASTLRRRAMLIGATLVAIAWIFALVWSVTVTTHSPERLDAAAATTVTRACDDAQAKLKALPNAFPRTGADRVTRIRAENTLVRAMVTTFQSVNPRHSTPRTALRAWSADWLRVVEARERYAHDLETAGRARFVLPAAKGVKPVTDKMDDFVRESHPDLDACFTEALAIDTVEGPREYKKVTQ